MTPVIDNGRGGGWGPPGVVTLPAALLCLLLLLVTGGCLGKSRRTGEPRFPRPEPAAHVEEREFIRYSASGPRDEAPADHRQRWWREVPGEETR